MEKKKPWGSEKIDPKLVWSGTVHSEADHRAEGLASGSVNPVGSEKPEKTPNAQKH